MKMIMALKLLNNKMNKSKKIQTLHLETQKIQQVKHLKKIRGNLSIKAYQKIMKNNQNLKLLNFNQMKQ